MTDEEYDAMLAELYKQRCAAGLEVLKAIERSAKQVGDLAAPPGLTAATFMDRNQSMAQAIGELAEAYVRLMWPEEEEGDNPEPGAKEDVPEGETELAVRKPRLAGGDR